jgi:hypothetical protein
VLPLILIRIYKRSIIQVSGLESGCSAKRKKGKKARRRREEERKRRS